MEDTLIILIDLGRSSHHVGGTFSEQPRQEKNTGEGRYLVSAHHPALRQLLIPSLILEPDFPARSGKGGAGDMTG